MSRAESVAGGGPNAVSTDQAEVLRTIAAGKRSALRRWGPPAGVLLVVALVAVGLVLRTTGEKGPRYEYLTAPATRGDLQAIVSATGNLKGVDTVEIGAEVNGKIKAVHVDFNDQVRAGDLLCEIDPQQLTAGRDQARAQLTAAEAEHRNRVATAQEARMAAERSKELGQEGIVSSQQFEAALAASQRAAAAVQSAAAQIIVARAALNNAQTALDKAWIRSPMDGVVLSRNVELGQTVIASLQSPVLFTIAKDLKNMELTVAIDEADIGQVREGQRATFTVDAYPERTFQAEVRLIQNVATVQDNVVTYQARLTVDNDALLLRPGMTATVNVLTAERTDVLLVPNAALRFKPPGAIQSRPPPFMPYRGPPRPAAGPQNAEDRTKAVWTLQDGAPARVPVEVGLTDGSFTEVTQGAIEPGAALLTDMIEKKE